MEMMHWDGLKAIYRAIYRGSWGIGDIGELWQPQSHRRNCDRRRIAPATYHWARRDGSGQNSDSSEGSNLSWKMLKDNKEPACVAWKMSPAAICAASRNGMERFCVKFLVGLPLAKDETLRAKAVRQEHSRDMSRKLPRKCEMIGRLI